MRRRDFLRRCALIAAGVVAADQIDLLDMLAPRRLFPSVDLATRPFGEQQVRYQAQKSYEAMGLTLSRHYYDWDENRIPLTSLA